MKHLTSDQLLGLVLAFYVSFLDIAPTLAVTSPTPQPLSQSEQKVHQETVATLSPKVELLKRNELIKLGKAYSALGNSTGAIKTFTTVLSTLPKDVEAKTLIGAEQIKMGKEKEGMQMLKSVLEINKKYLPAYKHIISLYEKRNNKYELRMVYNDLMLVFGKKIEYVTKLCELTTLDAYYDQAISNCEAGIQLDKEEPLNFIYLGVSLRERGEGERADKLLKSAADHFKNNELAQVTYAQHLELKKDYITAYSYYKKAVAISPDSPQAVIGLANSAFEIQKYEEAMGFYLKACKLDKKNLTVFRRATNVLRLMKISDWLYKYEKSQQLCSL